MVVSSATGFRAAVRRYRLDGVALDPEPLAQARETIEETGLLLVGEPHGVQETAAVLYALANALDARAVAFEWSHEEVDGVLQRLVREGSLDLEGLWNLPGTAEFFSGDGRVTAGHFALLQRLRDERRLDATIAFDRLDPQSPPDDQQARDREMAARLLTEWDGRTPLLALVGGSHARLDAEDVETMAMHLARRIPRLRPAMIAYAAGRCWWRGAEHDLAGPMPPAPIVFTVPRATPATVPGPPEQG